MTTQDRRTPPHNVPAEVALLATMLAGTVAIEAASDHGVNSSAFYNPSHGIIFDAIIGVYESGEKPEVINVTDLLERRGMLPDLDIGPFLTDLSAKAPSASGATGWAKIIARDARARRGLELAAQVGETIYGHHPDWESPLIEILGLTDAADSSLAAEPLFNDIALTLSGVVEIMPTVALRTDGFPMLYPGRVNGLVGPPESQKSMLAQWWCVEQMLLGEHVFYIDFEDDAYGVLERLRAMGAGDDMLIERFSYASRQEPWRPADLQRLYRALGERKPTLCVIDGVTNAMTLDQYDLNSNTDAAKWMGGLPRALTKHGAAVLTIDHVSRAAAKDPGARGGIGAQHKLAAIDGALLKIAPRTPFGRGRTGTAEILIDKDRPGQLRGRAAMGRMLASVTFRSEADGDIGIVCAAPTAQQMANAEAAETTGFRMTGYMERISGLFMKVIAESEEGDDVSLSGRAIEANIKGNTKNIRSAIADMVHDGYLAPGKGGKGGGIGYRLVRPVVTMSARYAAIDEADERQAILDDDGIGPF